MSSSEQASTGPETPRGRERRGARAEADANLASVVIVNYNGERYLPAVLDSLLAQTYPRFEVVVVDNASSDSSLRLLSGRDPRIEVVRSIRNLGFAAGNNLGVARSRGAYVALLNSDTVVPPDWLRRLVGAIEEDPAIAAVGSKITFLKPFVPLTLRVRTPASGAEGSEPSPSAGMRVDESSHLEGCDYVKPLFGDTFGSREVASGRVVRRARVEGELRLPFEPERPTQELALVAASEAPGADCTLEVELGGRPIGTAALTGEFAEHRFRLPAEEVARRGRYVINNAGTLLDARGVAGDRGIHALDEGQYDEAEDAEALCGCAMLVRRSAFEAVGGFDPAFFMYFEDVDLSWRLRRRGFRLRYEPAAVVRHVHAGTSTEGSPLFLFHTARNRLLMLLKNAPWSAVASAWRWELGHTKALLRGWAGAPRGTSVRAAARADLWLRLRVLGSALLHAPGSLVRRWRG